jgi:branched-chain amino acid transport system permease protein
MQDLVQLLVSGVALGSVYALAALGFVTIYSATGIVNFAAGQFVMFGAMFGVTTVLQLGLPMPMAILLAVAMMGVFGFLFYLGVHLPLRTQSPVTVVIATVMIGLSMQNGANLIWGSVPFRLPSPFGDGTLTVFDSAISTHALASIGITAVLVAALYVLMQHSWTRHESCCAGLSHSSAHGAACRTAASVLLGDCRGAGWFRGPADRADVVR